MIIAAFDLGRNLGWATNWKLARRPWGLLELHETQRPHRIGQFMQALQSGTISIGLKRPVRGVFPAHLLKNVDAVVYETPFARGYHATRSMWGLAGVLEACASERGIPVVDVSVSTIKKFATGHGFAPKDSMVAAACKLGYRGKNDNEADAYCLLKYAEANLERVITEN